MSEKFHIMDPQPEPGTLRPATEVEARALAGAEFYVQCIDRNERTVGLHEELGNGSTSLTVSFRDIERHWVHAWSGERVVTVRHVGPVERWHIWDVCGLPMRRVAEPFPEAP